jgi:hypothetical protein
VSNLSPQRTSPFLPREVPPHPKGHNPFVGPTTTASYTNVVALRPPSLREKTTALILARRRSSETAQSTSQIEPDRSLNEILVIVSIVDVNHEEIRKLTSNKERVSLLKESERSQWTTVKHRHRVRCLGSMERTRKASKEVVQNVRTPNRAKEQMFKPEAAAKSLTAFEKRERMSRLQHREKSLAIRRCRSSSRGKRPSNLKELDKCVDTQKWVNITHVILDLECLNMAAWMLAACLNSLIQWNNRLEATGDSLKYMSSKRKRERTHQSVQTSHPCASQPARTVTSLPAAQSANSTGNYLQVGVVLWDVGRHHPSKLVPRRKHPSYYPPDSGSSADDSKSDDSLHDSILNDHESDEAPQFSDDQTPSRKRHGKKHGRNKGRHQGFTSWLPKMKSILPLDYDPGGTLMADGSLRPGSYVRESATTSDLRDENVHRRLTKVSRNEKELGWNLLEFYDESLEYCFSVEHQMQVQKISVARHDSHQINKSISEYTYTEGLQTLSNMIRVSDVLPDRDKIIKFWIGFRPIIHWQKSFRQLKINAEIPSWKQITTQVEFVEISKDVVKR